MKIQDAALVSTVTGTQELPVSDGTNSAKKVNLEQIKAFSNKGLENKFATKAELDDIKHNRELFAYGVEWDVTVSNPHLIRIGNLSLHHTLPVQSLYKGCVVKNGVVNYYLDPYDWNKKENGEPSVLDGTDGNVYVEIPTHYFKSEINGNKRCVYESLVKIDDSWTEVKHCFVAAYRNTVSNNKTWSVVNKTAEFRGGGNRADRDQFIETDPSSSDLCKPRTNINRETMRKYANASNEQLLSYDDYKFIFYWNYVIEYANFNSQEEFNGALTAEGYHQGGLGAGVTNVSDWGGFNGTYPVTPCGYCNEFGNFTGIKELVLKEKHGTLLVPRWRGFDNPFGDIWTNLDGIVIKREAANEPSNVYTTNDETCFDDRLDNKTIAGVEVAQDGYTKLYNLGATCEIIPSEIGGSEKTYKCDYHWCNASYTGARALRVGSNARDGALAGLGYFSSSLSVGSATTSVGFRTIVKNNLSKF